VNANALLIPTFQERQITGFLSAAAQKVSPDASRGVTHALRGLPWMATQGLGGAWIAQPNETHASNGRPLTATPGLLEAWKRSATVDSLWFRLEIGPPCPCDHRKL
jgi:hypothetical protein